MIDYVKRKYGSESVSRSSHFPHLFKAAIKDVGRVVGVPLQEVNRITKFIPSIFGESLQYRRHEEVPELREVSKPADPRVAEMFKYAKTLEGMNRNSSKHAAGLRLLPVML
ncbi:MAG: hypothetical protein IPG53_19955 [Ignavibacteriales bacterium]|nr:hypothetical protein [Ignavibacteriales bacterium]